jgi:hypothetical protein
MVSEKRQPLSAGERFAKLVQKCSNAEHAAQNEREDDREKQRLKNRQAMPRAVCW